MWVRPPTVVVCACAASSRRSRGDGNPSPAPAVDSSRRGNDECGCARRPPSFVGAPPPPVVPVETGTHRRPPPWIPAVAGMTNVGAPAARRRLWVRRLLPSFPWRREPIAGPPSWIPAVAGMTIVGSPAASRRLCVRRLRPSFPWRREPIAGPAVVDSRRRGNDDCGIARRPLSFVGAPAASRRSRGDGNPSPARRRGFPPSRE